MNTFSATVRSGNKRGLLVYHRYADRHERQPDSPVRPRAVDAQGSCVGLVDAGQDLHHRRLAGPVLADKAVGFTPVQLDRPVTERPHDSKRLSNVFHHQKRHRALSSAG